MRIAGLMSGTSADGVDVAIIDFDGSRVQVRAFEMIPYPPEVREEIFRAFRPETGRVDAICRLNFTLGEMFAKALMRLSKKSGIGLETIDLVGSHGQTIYHIPERPRSTLQIGEPSVIAERTGITTVADFRPRDIAAGGQGAPLVPFADYLLFRDPRKNRALQNIGGIANVTYLPAGGGIEDVLAFDTGPGNMVIDRLIGRLTQGQKAYDAGGDMAGRGTVHAALLGELLRHPYFRRRPPKTTGREVFGTQFTDAFYRRARALRISPQDMLATATALTARSIAEAYRKFLPAQVDEMILCGGGAWNVTLVAMLQSAMPETRILRMSDLGISPDAKEAISFAILAYATVHGLADNVPAATGARRAAVLGKIVPAN